MDKSFTVLGIVMQCGSVQYENKMHCLEHNALASSGCISQNRGELGVLYRGYNRALYGVCFVRINIPSDNSTIAN